jgi:glycosyltransferase involved in cell wall biosynthesis
MDNCDSIIVFSNDSKKNMESIFGELININVIPHIVDYVRPVIKSGKTTTTMNIGLLGYLHRIKGSGIVREMTDIITDKYPFIRLILIGTLGKVKPPIKRSCFFQTGKYNLKDLPEITEKYDIDIFLIPSIWPETFSYTTQEIIEMGMPVACFDLGAPAERAREYEQGLIIPEMTAESALVSIIKWYESQNGE